jgi:uncharacterized protein DUF1524
MYRKALVTMAVALLLPWTLGAAAPGQQPPDDDDDLLTIGRWNGVAEGSMSRSTDLLTVGYEMTAQFWFDVAADGRIENGWAVVTYSPSFNADGLNQALEEARSLGNPAGLPFPIPVGLVLSDLLAVRGEYDQPMSTIQGVITGQLTGDTLSIAWGTGVEQIELPISIFIDGVGGTSEPIAHETLATTTPWPESATVIGDDGVARAERITEQRSQEGGVVSESTTTWSAGSASTDVPGGSEFQPVPPVPPRPAWTKVRFNLPSPAESMDQLDALTVAPEGSIAPYQRDEFEEQGRDWTVNEEGCTTRQVVLRLDALLPVRVDRNCEPIAGIWFSPYDIQVLQSTSRVDIDHMVPLKEAWLSGAEQWSHQRRVAFANDIERPQLLAVSMSENRSKGESDPSRWVPQWVGFDCDYARMWIRVKFVYNLSLQQEEKKALIEMLEGCPAS